MLSGVFGLLKEKGETSRKTLNRLQALIRKDVGKIKIGHGGTLDPLATGVLIVGLGTGCKKLNAFLQGAKQYTALVKLGEEHDTLDRTGKLLRTDPNARFSPIMFDTMAQKRFVGKIKQRPPVYSAIHINGQRAHQLARKAALQPTDIPEREVVVERLLLRSNDPDGVFFELVVWCQGGVYVRSLVHDLCHACGTIGTVHELHRNRQGPLSEEDCLSIAACEDLSNIKAALSVKLEPMAPVNKPLR